MMADFKAKYHALHIMQKLASGERPCNQGGRSSESPRKPGIRSSDDILREKYAELAELMAVQHMEQRAVSALQKMYLSPRKEEKKPSKCRRRKDGGRFERSRKRDNCLEKERKQRPQSASSNSSFSSCSSAKSSSSRTSALSNSSGVSNASRSSSRSNSSMSSSKSSSSTASSRSSTRSRSSGPAKPVSRHFVTIVEEEEEEEVVNQEKIQERQVVKFDEEFAKENEEEARVKKDASKRTRRVSFVLEAEEQSSDEEDVERNSDSDDTLKNVERVIPGQEDENHINNQPGNNNNVDTTCEGGMSGGRKSRSQYIEIQNSILREILSPRSPRRMAKRSPRSDEGSPPRRSASKSPVRSRRSISPKRAWELSDTLPPRPKRDVSPCDHKLSNVDDPAIRKWLRHKNALIRRQKKAELRKEREEREAAEALSQKVLERHTESEQLYDTWLKEKRQSIRKQQKMDRITAREKKKREEEERAKHHEMIKEKQRKKSTFNPEKVPISRTDKRKRKAKSINKESSSFDKGDQNIANGKNGKRNFPSSNPFKGLTYDQWMKQKLEQEQSKKKDAKSTMSTDPELEDIIPRIAKERIQRAAGRKGKRVDSGLRKDCNDLPECKQPSENLEQPKPYTWKQDNANPKSASAQKGSGNQEAVPKRAGLQRPSTAQNRLSGGRRGHEMKSQSASSQKPRPTPNQQHHRVFSPTSARPEPYGSESNDDHSETGAKLGSFQNKQKPLGTDGNNNSHNDSLVSKAIVKREGRESQSRDIILDPGDLSVFMTEPCS